MTQYVPLRTRAQADGTGSGTENPPGLQKMPHKGAGTLHIFTITYFHNYREN